MKIKFAVHVFALAFVASNLVLEAPASAEPLVEPEFSARTSKAGAPEELDQAKWAEYRGKMASIVSGEKNNVRNALQQMRAQSTQFDSLSVSGDKRQMFDMFKGLMSMAVRKFQQSADTWRKSADDFGAAVSEARRLCIQTSSWACSPESGEFQTHCTDPQGEMCRVQSDFDEVSRMMDEAIAIAKENVRKLERY